MKYTLEFTLPDDEQNLLLAMNAHHLHSALQDADRILRAVIKHGGSMEQAIEAARSEIAEALGRVEP